MEYHDVSAEIELNTEVLNDCNVYCHKNALVATFTIDGVNGSKSSVKGELKVLATGLPKAISEFQDLTIMLDNQTTFVHHRAWVNRNGDLFLVINEAGYTGNIFVGGTYACQ